MRLFRSVIDPGCRWLANRLNRLRRTLEGLYDRLREAIAVAVARAAAAARRGGGPPARAGPPPPRPPHPPRRNFAPSPGWRDTDDEYDELRRWEENLDDDQEPEGRGEARSDAAAKEPAPEPTRLRRALAEGLQAAGWWLRRGGRFPVLTALGAGLAVLWASYFGGPLAGARVRLAGSALGLLSLGQGTLAAFGGP